MSLRERTRPGLGVIEPCLPSPAKAQPSGPGWIHEIKHDGFRILARRDSAGVRLITRAGNDFSSRFPSKLKPEAAYFVAEHGLRSAMIFFDTKDASEIPAIANDRARLLLALGEIS